MDSRLLVCKDNRLILPFFFFLTTTIYLYKAVQIRPQIDEGLVGPSFIPILASVLMYISLGFVVRKILITHENYENEKNAVLDIMLTVISTAIYIFIFKFLGYMISTFLYVYALLYVFKFDEKNQMKRILYVSVITGIFYLLFAVIFNVRLPDVRVF